MFSPRTLASIWHPQSLVPNWQREVWATVLIRVCEPQTVSLKRNLATSRSNAPPGDHLSPRPPTSLRIIMAKKKSSSQPAAKGKSAKPKSKPKSKARATQTLTQKIEAIDAQLVELVNRRIELFCDGVDSDSHHASIFDVQDETDLWKRIDSANNGPVDLEELKYVFRPILSASRQRIRKSRVAYLGPAYSFTHLAAINRFGESADLVPVSTIATVFEEVNRGQVEFGLVPIENSTDGRIVDTLDMFTRLPLRICGEIQIQVHHNLLARCDQSEITEIYSKPQALSQCRDWLAKNMSHARPDRGHKHLNCRTIGSRKARCCCCCQPAGSDQVRHSCRCGMHRRQSKQHHSICDHWRFDG